MLKVAIEGKEMARVNLGGILAGVVGGVFVSLVMMAMTAIHHQNLWVAVKGASAPFFRHRAVLPGFDAVPVLIGFVTHFAVSISWGWLFALVFYGVSRQATLLAGVLWGVFVWLVMYHVVLPLVGLGEMARGAPVGMAILQHVAFGMVVAVAFLPFQRRVIQRWPPLKRTARV